MAVAPIRLVLAIAVATTSAHHRVAVGVGVAVAAKIRRIVIAVLAVLAGPVSLVLAITIAH